MNDATASDAERRAAMPSYVSICRKCGYMNGAIVDDDTDRKSVANFVAEEIRYGQIIVRLPVSMVRTIIWCNCHEAAEKQGALL